MERKIMSKIIEKDPPARTLIFGIRAIGYNFSTAAADIIDNSISAKATKISIYSESTGKVPYFCFLDNGRGMNADELENAMLLGSDRKNKPDSLEELGRFGLGLKTASLSQCREFIVVSKKAGSLCAIAFDLDLIEKSNKWQLVILNFDEIKTLPLVDKLNDYKTGTLVIWEKFDKLEGLAKNFEDTFRSAVADVKKHVEFVFHRFYNEIDFRFNEKKIDKRDPFLLDSVGRQQTGRTSEIIIDGEKIIIIPYSLPFANLITTEERALLGNPKSIYDEQGFYLYRNKRLICWGSWLHMGIKSELNKLARIKVDIPSTLDQMWMLDVKKSSAKIPDKIKDQIKASVEDSVLRSKKTTKFPGIKEQSIINKVWNRINEHEGNVRYSINRENPLITTLFDLIGENEYKLLQTLLSQLECYIPKYSMQNDNADSINIVNTGDDIEEDRLIDELVDFISLIPDDQKQAKLEQLLRIESYQKLLYRKLELIKKVLG